MAELVSFMILIVLCVPISRATYSCSVNSTTFWYMTSAKNGDAYSMANVSAGLCYGNFSNGASANSSEASKICRAINGHLAVAYTLDELYTLYNFTSKVNASLSLSLSGISYTLPIIKFPFWIGLRRNESNLSIVYWKDECRNPMYRSGLFSLRDIIGNNKSYSLDVDGYESYDAGSVLPYFLCRKNSSYTTYTFFVVDFNKCGSNPCLNGGLCVNYGQCFYCNCSLNFSGDFCQFGISSSYYNNAECGTNVTLNSNFLTINSTTMENNMIYSNPNTMSISPTINNSITAPASAISTIRVRTWQVHYLMTTMQPATNATTGDVTTKKIFNAYNLSKVTWFAMGLAAFLALVVFIVVCNCICGPPQPKYEPFT
uniref:EGF-like domain-containing protein n=1 Tax=Romanomermis culicivorax TaxID=13658 RepID=A0A915IFK9_ROMCU